MSCEQCLFAVASWIADQVCNDRVGAPAPINRAVLGQVLYFNKHVVMMLGSSLVLPYIGRPMVLTFIASNIVGP